MTAHRLPFGHTLLRSLGPAIAAVPPREALRAGLGALLGLGLVGLFVLAPTVDLTLGLYLIAPFGATSVLIFAVPNSPLAQPWSVIVGNTVSGLVGTAACLWVPDPALAVAVAVGAAITAMGLVRAVHPPGGAVAMTAAMSPEAIHHLGAWFALAPVALGSALLVAFAAAYAHATGRRYPFRQFAEPAAQGTADAPPAERLGLSEAELTEILQRYNQSLNLGVRDLARLVGAAEMTAAGHRSDPLVAADIMSRDLVTVGPDTPVPEIAEQFRQHGFTALPVVEADDAYLGVIFQMHLIRGTGTTARTFPRRDPVKASAIMTREAPFARPDSPIAALLPVLAGGGGDAMPVLARGRIVGIVTRSDLIGALARQSLA